MIYYLFNLLVKTVLFTYWSVFCVEHVGKIVIALNVLKCALSVPLCVCVHVHTPSCLHASEHFRSDVGKTSDGSVPPLLCSIANRADKEVGHVMLVM